MSLGQPSSSLSRRALLRNASGMGLAAAAAMLPVKGTYDPADTPRFYALRLKEAGLITSTPDQILAKGTDFRFLQELKQELKGG